MEPVNVRNLEQIQEDDGRSPGGRLAALLLASVGGAALVMVFVMMAGGGGSATRSEADPLASLVASARRDGPPAEKLDGKDVSFPRLLSDEGTPTTALAAVKDARGRLVEQGKADANLPPEEARLAGVEPAEAFELPPGAPSAPPPAGDRLPVVPLPTGSWLQATAVTKQPKDALTRAAAGQAKLAASAEPAPPGVDRGYQIQVASFKQPEDADALVERLRKKGHQAFRQAAYVPQRGLWHRVRVGPFKNGYRAKLYKKKFERKERMNAFVVNPHKVKLAARIRKAKLEARKRKAERRRKRRERIRLRQR